MPKRFLAFLAAGLLWAGLALAQININSASKEQLGGLKGIGPTKAQAIIDYRRQHGPFKSVDELENLPGIGPATLKEIRGDVMVNGPNAPRTQPTAPAKTPAQPATPASRPPAAQPPRACCPCRQTCPGHPRHAGPPGKPRASQRGAGGDARQTATTRPGKPAGRPRQAGTTGPSAGQLNATACAIA